jgi:hypothetical protein
LLLLLPFAFRLLSLLLEAMSSRRRIVALDAFPTKSFVVRLIRLCERSLPAEHDRGKRRSYK